MCVWLGGGGGGARKSMVGIFSLLKLQGANNINSVAAKSQFVLDLTVRCTKIELPWDKAQRRHLPTYHLYRLVSQTVQAIRISKWCSSQE